ncbi:hypothetical protein GCM10010389_61950 [Streptomyces echinoruber]|uniref:DDE Tnp4 domain-containing protein n=1 Tax=Streptomyces echinoruber TaxID=68898 RepID=A0A918VQR4_9ACTN|nr:hypothetical protein GCM10010389_61950 [Streptomyces echinoruber]
MRWESDHEYVLLDGTPAACDQVGDSRVGRSLKHRRHGVNVQVMTDLSGRLPWISPAPPGRTHRIIRIRERPGAPSSPIGPTWAPGLG